MSVRWENYLGHATSVTPTLHRALGQYARRSSEIKIGLTIDPERRWGQHANDGWREMVVLYATRSRKYCGHIEKQLINRGWTRHSEKCCNLRNGGGGLAFNSPWYYIYVICA